MPFHIFPAIDIHGGRCVRLIRGDFAEETVYHQDPLEAAARWKEQGARRLHVVDLDGAKEGRPVNRDLILRIARDAGLFIQCGGGIRKPEDLRSYLECGVNRVILGSAALLDRGFLEDSMSSYPKRVLGGLDLREGRAAMHGWTNESALPLEELLRVWREAGLEELVVTDIQSDGTLSGYSATETLLRVAGMGFRVIASGGVSGMDDLASLKSLAPRGVTGVIVGKALYDGRINLTEALLLEEDDGNDAG